MKLPFFIFFLFCFLGCTVGYTTKLDEIPNKVIVVGQITDTLSCNEIRIARTVPYYSESDINGISNAKVKVSTSDGEVYIFREDSVEQGLYKSEVPFAGRIGVKYYLNIRLDSNNDGVEEIYEASSVMQPYLLIDSIKFSCRLLIDYHIYPLTIYIPKPFSQKYILVNYIVNGVLVTPKIIQWLAFDSKLLDGDSLKGINLVSTSVINTLMDINDRSKCSDNVNKDPIFVKTGDSITVLFSRIDEDFYNFIKQCKAVENIENPIWGGNNANIITNLSGGALGFFSTRSIIKKKNIIP